ncbi:MAG: hypothetical protein M0P19_11045 [Nevskia sp.]|nr:hypothetical protein [Nevskia sp.]
MNFMAGFGQGGSVNMSPTASFLNRALRPARSSMAGADAIAPPSRIFQKPVRKGIASLPSPKKARGPQFLELDPQMAQMDNGGVYAHGEAAPYLGDGQIADFDTNDPVVPMMKPVLGSTRPYPRGMDPMQDLDPMSDPNMNPGLNQLEQLKQMFPDVQRQPLPNELRDQMMMSRAQQGVDREELADPDGRLRGTSSLTPETFDAYRMKTLQDQFRQSVTNKQQFDHLTNQAWNRDDRDARYDEGIANVLNPLVGAFMGKGSRAYLDADSASKLKRLDSHRNSRIQEHYAQSKGDNEMNDLLMELDPNTPKNMDARRGRNQGYMNSISSMNSSIDRGENYDSMGQRRDHQNLTDDQKLDIQADKLGLDRDKFRALVRNQDRNFAHKEKIDNSGSYVQQNNIRLGDTRNAQTAVRDSNTNSNQQANIAAKEKEIANKAAASGQTAEQRKKEQFINARRRDKDGNYIFDESARRATAEHLNRSNRDHVAIAREAFQKAKTQLPTGSKAQVEALAAKLALESGLIVE